jgi:hypothetical protein
MSGGPGWWQASDGKWYPPERHADPEWRARHATPVVTPTPASTPDPRPMPLPEPLPAPVGAGGGKGRPRWLVPVAVIAVIAIVVATAAYLLGSAQDGDGTATDTTGQAITLEAASNPGPNPFTTDLTVNEIAAQPDAIDAVTAIQADLPTDDLTGTLIATGTTPGLYGGTTNDQACDPTQLAEFLTDPANTDKATAWAQAQNIPVDNIDTFITNLTPVTLTTDTWVTNNGYKNGEPTPYQAVLQAGTAVLVDDTGTPRTKCSCGNPLTQAQPDNTDPATTTGDNPWNGYTTQTITIVDAGDQTDTLTLTDLDTGQPIEQPIGTNPGSELVLAPDGLGVVTFGQSRAEVEATLTELLGPPTEVSTCDVRTQPSSCTAHDPQGTYLSWDALQVYFPLDSGGFGSYWLAAPYDVETNAQDVTAGPPAETPEAIGLASTVDELFAAYTGLLAYECDYDTYEETIGPASPMPDGTFLTAEDGYWFVVVGGQVTSIHHDGGALSGFRGCSA